MVAGLRHFFECLPKKRLVKTFLVFWKPTEFRFTSHPEDSTESTLFTAAKPGSHLLPSPDPFRWGELAERTTNGLCRLLADVLVGVAGSTVQAGVGLTTRCLSAEKERSRLPPKPSVPPPPVSVVGFDLSPPPPAALLRRPCVEVGVEAVPVRAEEAELRRLDRRIEKEGHLRV